MYKEVKIKFGCSGSMRAHCLSSSENLEESSGGVKLPSGLVLMEDWHDYYLTIEEIQEIYGGEIVEIEILQEDAAPYFHQSNFPKIKNRDALERCYQKYKAWMASLATKHLNYRDWVKTQKKDK